MDKENKIKAMELMFQNHTTRQMAEFIVNLDESVEGLGKNNRLMAEAYRKSLSSKPQTSPNATEH